MSGREIPPTPLKTGSLTSSCLWGSGRAAAGALPPLHQASPLPGTILLSVKGMSVKRTHICKAARKVIALPQGLLEFWAVFWQ